MNLNEYLVGYETNEHADQGQMPVKCNAVYKAKANFNCYLTPAQAIEVAQNLLSKARILIDHQIEGAVVQLWNKGESSETLYFGLTNARKGPRRKAKAKTA